MKNTTRKKIESLPKWKVVVFSVLPLLVTLALTEGGLRVWVSYKARVEAGRSLPTPAQRNAYQRADPVLVYALIAGYDAGGIRVNGLGFRGSELLREKGSGEIRIFSVGDSTTFGLAGEECPYPAQL